MSKCACGERTLYQFVWQDEGHSADACPVNGVLVPRDVFALDLAQLRVALTGERAASAERERERDEARKCMRRLGRDRDEWRATAKAQARIVGRRARSGGGDG